MSRCWAPAGSQLVFPYMTSKWKQKRLIHGFTQLVESLKQQQYHRWVPFSSRSGALDRITPSSSAGGSRSVAMTFTFPLLLRTSHVCWHKGYVIRSKASEQQFKRALWGNFNCRYFPLVTNWALCVASSLCALILLVLALASILRYLFFSYRCVQYIILMCVTFLLFSKEYWYHMFAPDATQPVRYPFMWAYRHQILYDPLLASFSLPSLLLNSLLLDPSSLLSSSTLSFVPKSTNSKLIVRYFSGPWTPKLSKAWSADKSIVS